MGKQLRFIMDKEDEIRFLKCINADGLMVYEDNFLKPRNFQNMIKIYLESNCFKFYLYKKTFGEIRFSENKNGQKYINSIMEPVIEFRKTITRSNSKEITRGRLWVEMKNYDAMGNIVNKADQLDEDYKKLTQWIKKNIKRRTIQGTEELYKEYISCSLIPLVESGYKLLG